MKSYPTDDTVIAAVHLILVVIVFRKGNVGVHKHYIIGYITGIIMIIGFVITVLF